MPVKHTKALTDFLCTRVGTLIVATIYL